MKLSTLSLLALATSQLFSSSVFAENDRGSLRRRNMKKGKKGKKGKKMKSSSLVALIEGVGDDNEDVIGTSTLRFNMDGSFLLGLDVVGLPGDGSAMITDGTSCSDISENAFTTVDEYDGDVNSFEALAEGVSKSAFRFNNGHTREENMGKTVLLCTDEGEIIGCGVLGMEEKKKVLKASMGTYPGYVGPIEPVGKVTVAFNDDDTFMFTYKVDGLEANCVGCGIHIHAGTSCDTNELVEGHGWNSVVVQDLWTPAGGATYATNELGCADGYFEIFNGFGYEENNHHAVVIHGQDGTRMGCGILM